MISELCDRGDGFRLISGGEGLLAGRSRWSNGIVMGIEGLEEDGSVLE